MPGHALVDEAQRARRAHQADRRDDRRLRGQPALDRLGHEAVEMRVLERDLQLQEARAGAHLLQRAVDAVVVRRRARVLDRAEEEPRRRLDLAAREVGARRHRRRGGEQLDAVEVEHAPRLGLVARGHVVAGQAADVLDPVQAGPRDLGLEREAVAVAADELHDRLHPELLQRDRDRERRGVRVRGRVVGRVHGVDPVGVRREALVDRVEPARVDGQELGGDDETAGRDARPQVSTRHPFGACLSRFVK